MKTDATLIEALYKRSSVKPIVLIDECDVPLDSAYEHGYFDKFITTFSNMLSEGLKDNPYLGGAVTNSKKQSIYRSK